jgi:hypothetical protein
MYVSEGTLVYSGGGVQMKGSGLVENHGNFMVEGHLLMLLKQLMLQM